MFGPCFIILTYSVLCVQYFAAIIMMGKRKLAALLQLYSCLLVAIGILWVFLAVPWVDCGINFPIILTCFFPIVIHFQTR